MGERNLFQPRVLHPRSVSFTGGHVTRSRESSAHDAATPDPGIDSPASLVASLSPEQQLQWIASPERHRCKSPRIFLAVLGTDGATAAAGRLAVLVVSRRPRRRQNPRRRRSGAVVGRKWGVRARGDRSLRRGERSNAVSVESTGYFGVGLVSIASGRPPGRYGREGSPPDKISRDLREPSFGTGRSRQSVMANLRASSENKVGPTRCGLLAECTTRREHRRAS